MARSFGIKVCVLALVGLLTACDVIIEEVKRVKDIPLGTGHSAHELCSRIFVSGQDVDLIIEDILVQKVYPMQWVWNLDIDKENKLVSVGAPFFNQLNNATAVYREGQGCTVSNGMSREALSENAITPLALAQTGENINRSEKYWPLGQSGIHPDSGDYDLVGIGKAMDAMFEERFAGRFEQINTYSVLVIHNGKLVSERYSDGHDADNRMPGWSISKSITALLMGVLYAEGKLSLEDPVPLTQEDDHSLRLQEVFNMASGLEFNEGYEGESDISDMLYVSPDASAYALARPLIHEPGTVFNYSTGDTQILSDAVQSRAGGSAQDAYNFYQTELFHKLGINDAVVEHDASGTFIGGARMFMRPRDFAKIGLLMLRQGEWFGEQIVPAVWVKEMLKPSPADSGYGGQVWLYEAETFGENFPKDAFVLWGVLGQMVVVVPSEGLVVVRTGAKGSGLAEGIELDIIFNPILELIAALPRPEDVPSESLEDAQ